MKATAFRVAGRRRTAIALTAAIAATISLTAIDQAATAGKPVRPSSTPWVDSTSPAGVAPVSGGQYSRLVFSDEFTSAGVNSSKWVRRDWWRGGAVSPDTWKYDPANVVQAGNGNLEIKVTNPAPNEYHAGQVESLGKYSFKFGTLEARVKIPPTNGHLGAVWLMPANGFTPGGGTPDGTARDGAEIDIVESNFKADQFTTTIHWDDYYEYHQQSGTWPSAAGLHSGFHIFGMTWTPTKLTITYDGTAVRTITDPNLISQVAESPLLSHEILDQWADGSIHDETFDANASMYVDYIRVWQ